MGTRNLTLVQLNNEIKVAQYGQWDGVPEWQGLTILRFCRDPKYLSELKKRLKKVSFGDEKQLEKISKNIDDYFSIFLSRDVGGKILRHIATYYADIDILLKNEFDFGYDSLYCEWAYCVNYDTNMLEIYMGFNTKKLDKSERFYTEKPFKHNVFEKYYGIKKIKEYSLNDLPYDDVFVKELNEIAEKSNEDE